MADRDTQPKSRRRRRAAAGKKNDTSSTALAQDSDSDIPMVTPDYDAKPTGKTLYQIVDERYAEMRKNGTLPEDVVMQRSNGAVAKTAANEDDRDGSMITRTEEREPDPIGAVANAFIYTISLSMLHITLDVIVLSQYQQEIVWPEILSRITRMTPGLFVVVLCFHLETVKRYHTLRQLFFWVVSVVSGCYLIYAGNVYGYYFVMKRAPPVGTLWVWSVVEMDLWFAVVHALVVLGFMKYKKFRAF